jgi:hypothetical protein
MKKIFALVTLGLLVAVMSCTKNECDIAFKTYEFEVGKNYCIDDNSLFSIDSINDSRCPSNVECITAGSTKLYTSIFEEDVNILFDITVPNDNRQFTIEGNNLLIYKIDSITPYPFGGQEIPQSDYRVYMTILKKGR